MPNADWYHVFMSDAHTEKHAHCEHCGAALATGAKCSSCLLPPDRDGAEAAVRAERYALLPQRVPNGGIIMPQ